VTGSFGVSGFALVGIGELAGVLDDAGSSVRAVALTRDISRQTR
jgi:hypothetical protein